MANVNNAETHSISIDSLKSAVNELYQFRDEYVQKNGLEKAQSKSEDVEAKLSSTLEFINNHKESFEKLDRCTFYLQMGKALTISSKFTTEAVGYLSKAVKLDPKLVEGWNYLGECYWKTGEINDAKNCFEGALKYERNKVSLRNLSMTLRQIKPSKDKTVANVEESVKIAKEAVKLDLTDGISWMVLGNAYLTSFFVCGQNPSFLQNCMTAFVKAERDPIATGNPDLYYNKAVAYKYEEEYEKSLLTFERACILDPTWAEATDKKNALLSYLSNVQELIQLKGKVKTKKLDSMLNSLSPTHLGPYKDGGFTTSVGQSVNLELTPLKQLKDGLNNDKVVLGRVVCSVYSENDVPFTFCMVDGNRTCISVTVYNLAQGQGVIIGDSVSIPEPYLQVVQFTYQDKKYDFKSLRVSNPLVMVINGKKCNKNKVASSTLSISLTS